MSEVKECCKDLDDSFRAWLLENGIEGYWPLYVICPSCGKKIGMMVSVIYPES